MRSRERKFHAAVSIVQHLPKSGPIQTPLSTMLQFYGLYKQATEGPNTTPKPAFYDIVRKTKWDAWTKLGALSKEEAMQRYIDEFVSIVDSTTHGSNVDEMAKTLGSLYEAVNDEDIELLLGPTMDRLFEKTGSRKLVQLKDKVLKSRDATESQMLESPDIKASLKDADETKSLTLLGSTDIKESMETVPNGVSKSKASEAVPNGVKTGKAVPNGVKRHETRQSDYYMEAPSRHEVVRGKEVEDAYQLRSGEARHVGSGGEAVTTWSRVQQPTPDPAGSVGEWRHQTSGTSNSVSKQTQLSPSDQARLHYTTEPPTDRLQELSNVSEAVVSIEQELTHVAEKLNSISKMYKASQSYSSVSIPTLSLILVWPVLTQFVFMWYSNRVRYLNQPSR